MARERFETLVLIVVAMLLILAVAGAVVVYAAFPHRGMDVPRYPWVGEAMRKGVRALPTLDNQREHDQEREREHAP